MSDDSALRVALEAAFHRALLNVPKRISARIAAESDPEKVAEILRSALEPALAIAARLDELDRDA